MYRETEKRLVEALKTVSEDPEFILGVLVLVEKEKDRQTMIEYILSDEKPTFEDIILTAMEIDDQYDHSDEE